MLRLDKSIRFAGIANKDGKMIAHAYREGLQPLLTSIETEMSVRQSVIRTAMRKDLERKMGRTFFSYTRYEKVKRVTIPIHSSKSNNNNIWIFMASFDVNVDPEPLVMDKIIPLLDELVL
jgi:hypothetical protein